MLILLSTPIGNLGDITENVRNALLGDGVFAVEDTRTFKNLLNALNIPFGNKTITSFHDHSSPRKVNELIKILENKGELFLVSEAGSPIISDPGHPLISNAIEKGHSIRSYSGVCSIIYSLELSGLPVQPFHFHGFLSRENGKKNKYFSNIKKIYGTHIIFESPHRIRKLIGLVLAVVKPSKLVICREISKKFESIYRFEDTLPDEFIAKLPEQGEYVVLFYINSSSIVSDHSFERLRPIAQKILEKGISTKGMAKLVGEILNIDSKEVYQKLIKKGGD